MNYSRLRSTNQAEACHSIFVLWQGLASPFFPEAPVASLSPGKSTTGSGGSGVGGQPLLLHVLLVEELVVMEDLLDISGDLVLLRSSDDGVHDTAGEVERVNSKEDFSLSSRSELQGTSDLLHGLGLGSRADTGH